jgi:hypothetical protein
MKKNNHFTEIQRNSKLAFPFIASLLTNLYGNAKHYPNLFYDEKI